MQCTFYCVTLAAQMSICLIFSEIKIHQWAEEERSENVPGTGDSRDHLVDKGNQWSAAQYISKPPNWVMSSHPNKKGF
jgi:hypothetical protein